MKNKKVIYLFLSILIIVIALTTLVIRARLTDTGTTGPIDFTVGDVTYTWDGLLVEDPIVPGQDIIATDYTLTNASTVASELRFKIEVTSEFLEGADASSLVDFILGEGWVEESGYYYYRGTQSTEIAGTPNKYSIPGGSQVLPVITSFNLDGSKVGNDHSGKKFTITLTFEAKQTDYVTWAQLGEATIDFSTGL